jgi:acyl-CoA thioester hydrolase
MTAATATTATEPFRVRVQVRHSDIDRNGHVTTAAYLQYADHARWQLLDAAGTDVEGLAATGFGPVTLETRIRFHRELLAGGQVAVSCVFTWGEGRTGEVVQQLHRVGDGELVAEVESVGGVLDLARRRLVGSPAEFWRRHCARPELLGLPAAPD